jgi:ribosome-associated protein
MDIRKLQRAIVDGLEDVKAQDIVVFNTMHLSSLFERVIIASGTSNRQTKALASSIREAVKAIGAPVPRMEGEDNGEWIIVDCGAAVAHIMQPAIRDYYRLEEIWGGKAVKMKIGGGKTGLVKAEGDDEEDEDVPSTPKLKKPRVRTPVASATAESAAGQAALAGASAPKPARKVSAGTVKTAAAKAPAKTASKTATKTATKTAAPKAAAVADAPARKRAPRKTAEAKPVKTVVVNAEGNTRKPVAKKAPAKKAAVKTTSGTVSAAAKPVARKKPASA